MGFFKDSKPKKTEDEKWKEWFAKCTQAESKHFINIWANVSNDLEKLDRLVDQGYELITSYSLGMGDNRLVFKKPSKELKNGD